MSGFTIKAGKPKVANGPRLNYPGLSRSLDFSFDEELSVGSESSHYLYIFFYLQLFSHKMDAKLQDPLAHNLIIISTLAQQLIVLGSSPIVGPMILFSNYNKNSIVYRFIYCTWF